MDPDWDERYRTQGYREGREPAAFLVEVLPLLPRGRALDIAAGAGRNAVFLAENGFAVDAVDASEEGLALARRLAADRGVSIKTIAADLPAWEPEAGAYSVVLDFSYLDRGFFERIRRALAPAGVLVFETFTTRHLELAPARRMRREFLLEPGELAAAFVDLEILRHEEHVGRARATERLLARKPAAPPPRAR
ncbi:MAG: methyltransferase domain-containing protein [Planctomycetes bacterium]|nr:methyltransferase domain-containing protein [Planctomycetota bacterium]